MATCDECRWKTERKECPWDYMYNEEEVDYAEDCVDFRNVNFKDSEFQQDVR